MFKKHVTIIIWLCVFEKLFPCNKSIIILLYLSESMWTYFQRILYLNPLYNMFLNNLNNFFPVTIGSILQGWLIITGKIVRNNQVFSQTVSSDKSIHGFAILALTQASMSVIKHILPKVLSKWGSCCVTSPNMDITWKINFPTMTNDYFGLL